MDLCSIHITLFTELSGFGLSRLHFIHHVCKIFIHILLLAWLIVFLTNGQIYVHEICKYPYIQHTFILWSDEDFAYVKNVWVECISNDQCLIFFSKMAFILVIVYSLTEKQILSTKKEMIPKTVFISGNLYSLVYNYYNF